MNRTQPSFLKGLHPDADDFGLFSCEAHGRPNVTNFKDPTLEDAEVFVSRLTTPTVCDLRQLGKKSGLGLTRACPMRTRYTTTTFGLCPWLNIDVSDPPSSILRAT
jgi:hypothetical protein